MVKYPASLNPKLTIKLKIPFKTLLFWNRKIKEYLDLLRKNKKENIEYPTVYISKKHPKMGFLELYKKIKRYFKKHFPNIYKRINITSKESFTQLNYIKNHSVKNKEIIEINKKELLFQNDGGRRDLSEKIKNINEINCSQIKHLFKAPEMNDNIEKYDNCFVKIIACNKKNIKELDLPLKNKKDDNSKTSILSDNQKNKIYFVTQSVNSIQSQI